MSKKRTKKSSVTSSKLGVGKKSTSVTKSEIQEHALINKDIFNGFFWTSKDNSELNDRSYSQTVKNLTGYTDKEIFKLEDKWFEIIYENDLPNVKKYYSSMITDIKNFPTELEYRIETKNKELRWIKETINFKSTSDSKIIYSGFVVDINKFKEREESLTKQLFEQRELVSSRDNFLSILSHDLRAPFSSILGFTEVLLNEQSLSEQDKIEYLNYIHESASNQLQLVNYLLDWSNLQTGRMNIMPQRVHAQSLVFNCISSLTGNAIRKNIDIKVNIPDSLFIEADERLLTQVITNLVSNAIKFSTDGKTVNISAERFNQQTVEFTIKDFGVGISEEHQARIFKFGKIFSTKGTRGEKGTGLGLSLVKEIIERHKGQIWFYSQENVGSEFHFTIQSSENSILVIENIREDFSKYEKVIKEHFPQFKLVAAENGFEAINYVLKQHPSIIISSHDLPLMNGVQFAKSIMRGDRKFSTPIIAIMSSYDEMIRKSYIDVGIKTIFQKPVDLDKLTEEMSLMLN